MRGRPCSRQYPFTCFRCGVICENRQAVDYHFKKNKICPDSLAYDMAHAEKKSKGEVSFPVFSFSPEVGAVNNTLQEIRKFLELKKEVSIRKGRDYQDLVFLEVDTFFEKFDKNDLRRLKNMLEEKRMEFKNKCDKSEDLLDTMIEECSIIYGRDIFKKMIGEDCEMGIKPMERLIISHIRQRSLFELENESERFLEAVGLCVRQMTIIRRYEPLMEDYEFIQRLIVEFLNEQLTPPTLARVQRQFTTDGSVGSVATDRDGRL